MTLQEWGLLSLTTTGGTAVAVRSQAELGNQKAISQALPGLLLDIDNRRGLLLRCNNHQFVLHIVYARFESNHGISQLLGLIAADLASKNSGTASGKDL